MCGNCDTRKLCERLDRQIKNIEAGGSINPDALATILREARDSLERHANASTIAAAVLSGRMDATVVVVGKDEQEPGGGLH